MIVQNASIPLRLPEWRPGFFTTLSAVWIGSLLLVIAALTALTAREIADRIDRERLSTAQETMGIVAALAQDMNRGKPHAFIARMVETGQFQRIGVYCAIQNANVEGTSAGITKQPAPHPMALEAFSQGSAISQVGASEISLSRPLKGQDGTVNGAIYMTLDKTNVREVFWSLIEDLKPVLIVMATLAGATAVSFSHRLSRPINALTDATTRIADGALDTKVGNAGPAEIRSLSASINSMVSTLKQSLQDINRLAFQDMVTELPNRADFMRCGTDSVQQLRREPGSLIGVVFIDLDGFKAVNDTHGHEMGDKVLQHFAGQLNEMLRDNDGILNAPTAAGSGRTHAAMPARLGGDEFTVLLTGLIAPKDADAVAKRILTIFEKPIVIDDIPILLGASIGISVAKAQTADFDTLISQADEAMYDVKQSGKNSFKRVGLS